jgi:bifunctional DNA-binding transcriptional regulator/antitoxin component of YhaV-PrlF toxin-antitoxin module
MLPWQEGKDMAIGRVLSRGQVVLPQSVRRAAGYQPGDLVSFRISGPGTVEVTLLPRLTLREALERFRIEGDVDGDRDWPAWEESAAKDVLSGTGT